MKWLISLALLLSLAACGGGGGDDVDASGAAPSTESAASPDPSPSAVADPKADLERAYRTYVKAFLTGDGATAYGLLSKRCQAKDKLSEFAAASEAAADLYGDVDYTINSVTVTGDTGTLDATYAVSALNQGGGSEWVLEDGEWRSDKCD